MRSVISGTSGIKAMTVRDIMHDHVHNEVVPGCHHKIFHNKFGKQMSVRVEPENVTYIIESGHSLTINMPHPISEVEFINRGRFIESIVLLEDKVYTEDRIKESYEDVKNLDKVIANQRALIADLKETIVELTGDLAQTDQDLLNYRNRGIEDL